MKLQIGVRILDAMKSQLREEMEQGRVGNKFELILMDINKFMSVFIMEKMGDNKKNGCSTHQSDKELLERILCLENSQD